MAVSELPGNPNAVWTVKRNTEGELNTQSREDLFISAWLLPLLVDNSGRVAAVV